MAPPEPKRFAVTNIGHPAAMLGLIGAGIIAADENRKQALLADALEPQSPMPLTHLCGQLVLRLQQAGYDAQCVDGNWQGADGRYTISPDTLPTHVDAVLVLEPGITGFVSPPGADYLTTIQTTGRLYGKDRREVLLQARYSTGWNQQVYAGKPTPTNLPAFKNFDALMADPPATAQSLKEAAAMLAALMAQDLRR